MKICECGEPTDSYKCSLCQADESVGLAPKAEQDEPVAFFDEKLGRPVLLASAPMLEDKQPLYTHPQPRKPLTDEEIWNNNVVMSLNAELGLSMHDLKRITRTIEAAHGIKE